MRRKHMEHEIQHALHSPWFQHVALVLVGLVGVALAVFAYFNLASSPLPTTLTVQLTHAEGHVELGRNGQWQTAGPTTDLEENDQLRVVGDGKAVLALEDGSEVRLGSDTHIVLTNLSIREFRVQSESGLLYARIIPSPARSVTIVTDSVAYEALGTAFLVTNTKETESVEVYQSSVDVRLNSRQQVRVGQGESYHVRTADERYEGEITSLVLSDLQTNDFLAWNARLDKLNAENIHRLGLIEDID